MSTIPYKSKILGFYELLKRHHVEIPIIQRDYAQGRIDKEEIRINFLTALYQSLENKSPIKLDFIYGSNNSTSFQPLDGQQRLTTLFLLYWYAAAKDSELNEDSRKILTKFSYETRISSREFCHTLINSSIEINNATSKLSDCIIDSNWFFLSWKNDPTIDSMLRTIDDIHKIFFSTNNLWEKLTSNDSLISFYYVELENIGLTDDLYIKMNARGKLLTPFENFKASFQKFVTDNNWEQDKTITDNFACKIDTNWTDFFWNHYKKNNSIDGAFMRFISTIAMIRQTLDRTILKTDERTQMISNLQDEPNTLRTEYFTEASFNYLIKCFEIYEKFADNDFNLGFPLWRHDPKKSILSEIVYEGSSDNSNQQIKSASYTQKVLFFAQTEYLLRNEQFSESAFKDWMRVVRNIVSRASIDFDGKRLDIIRSPETFEGVINLVNELAKGCSDIYQHLSNLEELRSSFAKEQIEEEKLKAKLISIDSEYKRLLFDAEDNDLLRGRIDFMFYCIGYRVIKDSFDVELFTKIQKVFLRYFNEEQVPNDLRRAFLTIESEGKFEFYNYWWSFWNAANATKRRLFDKFRELEYYIYTENKIYFKKLVLLLADNDLKTIISDFIPPLTMPNWKVRLIKESHLLDSNPLPYIAIPNDNSYCYLLKSKRPRDLDGSKKIE